MMYRYILFIDAKVTYKCANSMVFFVGALVLFAPTGTSGDNIMIQELQVSEAAQLTLAQRGNANTSHTLGLRIEEREEERDDGYASVGNSCGGRRMHLSFSELIHCVCNP